MEKEIKDKKSGYLKRNPLKKAFIDGDGNLKPVLVGITAVLVLVILASVIIQLKKPTEDALVRITHVFKAKPEIKEKEKGRVEKNATKQELKSKQEKLESAEIEQGTKQEALKEKGNKTRLEEGKWRKPEAEKQTLKDKAKKPLGKGEDEGRKSTEPLASKKVMEEVKLSDEIYKKLYRHRFEIAKKGIQERYSWQVSNQANLTLRECYRLFDMKPVVITRGRYYDLSDLTLISKESLCHYSTTVIVCENPVIDFRKEIDSLGLKPDELTVHYYMYEYIRNYFYYRVEQAVNCFKKDIHTGKRDLEDQVEVVGNVFKIQKEGGGRFGVFLPTRIYYQRSESDKMEEIEIPISCFAGDEDIEILKKNGLI